MSKEGLLALKIKIDRALCHFGAGGHIVHGGAVNAVLKKHVARGGQNRIAPSQRFAFAAGFGGRGLCFLGGADFVTYGHNMTDSHIIAIRRRSQEAISKKPPEGLNLREGGWLCRVRWQAAI